MQHRSAHALSVAWIVSLTVALLGCGGTTDRRQAGLAAHSVLASKMFTDMAREVAPVNPDLGKLAAVAARHGGKFAG